jgi:hypothetical protein
MISTERRSAVLSQQPSRSPERIACERTIARLTLPDRERHWARARYATAHGVVLATSQALPEGARVELDLLSRGVGAIRVAARIRRSSARSGDQWAVHCHFVRPLSGPELLTLA